MQWDKETKLKQEKERCRQLAQRIAEEVHPGSAAVLNAESDLLEKALRRAGIQANAWAEGAEPADLLMFDEAGAAWELDMVDKDLLRRAVLERPAAQECVLTAHKAPQWMLDAADYSTEMKCCRNP